MTSRASFLMIAAAGALAAVSLPAQAAMPVSAPQNSKDLTLVQDQTATQPKSTAKTTKSRKSKRQQEIDNSVESGTVPRRYMQNVPKQYHDLIPWAK